MSVPQMSLLFYGLNSSTKYQTLISVVLCLAVAQILPVVHKEKVVELLNAGK